MNKDALILSACEDARLDFWGDVIEISSEKLTGQTDHTRAYWRENGEMAGGNRSS